MSSETAVGRPVNHLLDKHTIIVRPNGISWREWQRETEEWFTGEPSAGGELGRRLAVVHALRRHIRYEESRRAYDPPAPNPERGFVAQVLAGLGILTIARQRCNTRLVTTYRLVRQDEKGRTRYVGDRVFPISTSLADSFLSEFQETSSIPTAAEPNGILSDVVITDPQFEPYTPPSQAERARNFWAGNR